MNAETKKLFQEVKNLHDSNITAAQATAENAIRIGILLHQIKEQVGHGNFLPAMEEHAKDISERCCRNYMRLAEERLVEYRARALLPETASPAAGKSATVADLEKTSDSPENPQISDLENAKNDRSEVPAALPDNAIPADLYTQARAEVEQTKWLELPVKPEELAGGLHGKDLTELYRSYGVIREKEPKVYHPPKTLSPDERVAAENAQAEALVNSTLNALAILQTDLSGKAGICSTRIHPSRWKEVSRALVTLNKTIKPLTKRKLSAAEKKAETKAKAKALLKAVDSCQSALSASPAKPDKVKVERTAPAAPAVKASRTAKAAFQCEQCGCDSCADSPVLRCRKCGHYFCTDCQDNHEVNLGCKAPESAPAAIDV